VRTALLIVLLLVVTALPATAAGQGGDVESQDHPNVTCRMDAAAAPGGVGAHVTCLNLDPEQYGEHPGMVTVTLQRFAAGDWHDVTAQTCTGESVRGVLSLSCAAPTEAPVEGRVRGVVDLDAPKDWEPAVAEPTYSGGRPISDPLAVDVCDVVNEVADPADGTAPPAPWVDLCAVTMRADLTEDGEIDAVAVSIHVAGFVSARTPTASWEASLRTDDGCRHAVMVIDTSLLDGHAVAVDTTCEVTNEPCNAILALITELTGGACSSGSSAEIEERVVLPAEVVTFHEDEVEITLRPEHLDGLAARLVAEGTVVDGVHATATTGVGTGDAGARGAVVDSDWAHSTGRTFTVGD
jgi:hypothetical protein